MVVVNAGEGSAQGLDWSRCCYSCHMAGLMPGPNSVLQVFKWCGGGVGVGWVGTGRRLLGDGTI